MIWSQIHYAKYHIFTHGVFTFNNAQILEDKVISNGDLFEATLKTAREPKMGVTPLMKLHAQLFGEEISLGKPQWKRSLVDLSTKR